MNEFKVFNEEKSIQTGVPLDLFVKAMEVIYESLHYEVISQKAHDLLIMFLQEMEEVNRKEGAK